jgi:hypothetical protein
LKVLGWEEMRSNDYPCTCGKGTYTELIEMDDWNRMRRSRIIHCLDCVEKQKRFKLKLTEDQELLKNIVSELRGYFERNYIEQWVSYYNSAKTKKDVWAIANKIKVERSSLSTFYQRIKNKNINDYIKSLANNEKNILKIMSVLDIEDEDFKSKLEEVIELEDSVYKRLLSLNAW